VLTDLTSGEELDRGYLISAKDLGAYDHLQEIADAGIGCLKIEGRKKKPEYVATVTKGYREFLDRVGTGTFAAPTFDEVQPLVQIFSRGFTGGIYGGRAGRDYITRTQPDNHGYELGVVVANDRGEVIIDVRTPVEAGDGLGFEPPDGATHAQSTGFTANSVRTISTRNGLVRQAITSRVPVTVGWKVLRTAHAALLERARSSYAALQTMSAARKVSVDVRVFGGAGAPLKAIFRAAQDEVSVASEIPLAPATKRALDATQLREQFGRLGDTPFALGAIDTQALTSGLFIPVSELNHLRQRAVDELMLHREWALNASAAERGDRVRIAAQPPAAEEIAASRPDAGFTLSAEVFSVEDARAAAGAGANEIVFDPFLRHPAPPRSRVTALAAELKEKGITLRLRTPTIARPEDRPQLEKWLALDLPLLSGHVGLTAELSRAGRDVVADYAANCFNPHTAAELLRLGARRITASVELTADEIAALVAPWDGNGFDVVVFGRPEGMTLEHCVLSAAFDRVVTTCRDLCVQKHTNVELTDPTGYKFPVATDSNCRNRLLHSRVIEGSEFIPRLWRSGVRGYRALFNVAGEPVAEIVAGYRAMLDALARSDRPEGAAVRSLVGDRFTRGHFARPV
jgi:putative protease